MCYRVGVRRHPEHKLRRVKHQTIFARCFTSFLDGAGISYTSFLDGALQCGVASVKHVLSRDLIHTGHSVRGRGGGLRWPVTLPSGATVADAGRVVEGVSPCAEVLVKSRHIEREPRSPPRAVHSHAPRSQVRDLSQRSWTAPPLRAWCMVSVRAVRMRVCSSR
jgi:hypothetical protein